MSESWKHWQGRNVDQKFPLRAYLGGSDHSAVFLTAVEGVAGNVGRGDSNKAAIKLIDVAVDVAGGEAQSSRWQAVRELNHPSLIRILDTGRCELDGNHLLYVVMEYAEENLSQILQERALNAEETLVTLPPVLEVLQFVHDHGFVHGHIKPANILAIGNQVKLSSDTLSRTGETSRASGVSAYGPPEAAAGAASTAGDVWQLGMTLVEVLTQRLPVWDRDGRRAPIIPDNVPQPFRDIASNCLQLDAGKRCTVREISERLKTGHPEAGQRPEAGRRQAASDVRQNISAGARQQRSAQNFNHTDTGLQKESAKWPIWVAMAAVVAIAFVLIARPKRSNLRSEQPSAEARQDVETKTSQSADRTGAAAGVAPNTSDGASSEAGSNDAQLGVVQRVMPQVSPSAQRTIQGKIKVRVRAGVDATGNVSNATFESAGPSKYFSRISMEAAREWKFVPAEAAEQSGGREWRIQFAFTRANTEASAARVKR
jgi:TonB family protein